MSSTDNIVTITNNNDASSAGKVWEDRVLIVRKHFERKGYRVHSGLQFGCELVLYADDPSKVHSDFCVHVLPEDGSIDWRSIQTKVRSMPDFHKTLILAHLYQDKNNSNEYIVKEIAMATEHAPFRHSKTRIMAESKIGTQQKNNNTTNKKQKIIEEDRSNSSNENITNEQKDQ